MTTQQLPFPIFNTIEPQTPNSIGYQRRKVERTLTQVRQLHEQLNTLLYAHHSERPTILPTSCYSPFWSPWITKNCGCWCSIPATA